MKVSFVLLLEEETSSQCVNLSKEISSRYDSLVILGQKSLPHVTILQTECEEGELTDIWNTAKKVMLNQYKLNFTGLTLLPSSSGNTWLEIPVLKSDAILMLQKELLSLEILKNRKIYNGTEDNFRPHVTVGLINKGSVIQSLPLPQNPLRNKNVISYPSLGLVGENFIFTQSLFKIK